MGVARKLCQQGRIAPQETTVLCITGNGLKTLDALAGHFALPPAILPRLADFENHLAADRPRSVATGAS